MFCRTGAASDDQVGFRQHDEVVGRHVDGMQAHRRLEDVLVVDGDDERGRPELPRRQRDGAADQPEADDADLSKIGGDAVAAGRRLHDGQKSGN